MVCHAAARIGFATLVFLSGVSVSGATPSGTRNVVATATANQPARFLLGPAPPLTAGAHRRLEIALVGMDPVPDAAVSIVILLRASPDAPAAEVGRFTPYPINRIDPDNPSQHQRYAVGVDRFVPAQGGGNWEADIELDMSAGPGSGKGANLQFSQPVFLSWR
jgi:hypothetical protein